MRHRLLQTDWGKWMLFIAGWTLLSLLFAPEIYLYYRLSRQPIPWTQTVSLTLVNAGIALIFLPPIVWLTRRYPVERQTWRKALLVHVPACLVFSLSHSFLYTLSCYASPQLFHTLFVRFHPNLLTYWAIVGFTQAMDYLQRYRERERQLAQAELLLLKSQLHPHFLFNTLHTVSAMMHEDVKAADQTVNRLSDLLRMLLDNIGEHEVPLRKEIEFLQKYVEIEQVRFPDKLELKTEVEQEALDALVPNMLLQPLVENSIRHGIDLRQSQGVIQVSARRQGDRLHLSVSDDGRGVPPNHPIHEGLGLKNTRLRLQQLYSEAYSFHIDREPGQSGFRVSLEFPFREEVQSDHLARLEPQAYEDSSIDRRRRALGAKADRFPAQG